VDSDARDHPVEALAVEIDDERRVAEAGERRLDGRLPDAPLVELRIPTTATFRSGGPAGPAPDRRASTVDEYRSISAMKAGCARRDPVEKSTRSGSSPGSGTRSRQGPVRAKKPSGQERAQDLDRVNTGAAVAFAIRSPATGS
jgi:hypothetical protein